MAHFVANSNEMDGLCSILAVYICVELEDDDAPPT